jgi:hypothetical protein
VSTHQAFRFESAINHTLSLGYALLPTALPKTPTILDRVANDENRPSSGAPSNMDVGH